MSGRKKYRTANEYLQYLKGELSNRERHSFERNLEADPFDKEAMEGLEMLATDQAEEDILSLNSRIRKRLGKKRRIAWYSVAASIASLLIIGTVFLQIYDFSPKVEDEILNEELFAPGKSGESEALISEEVTEAEEQQVLQEPKEQKEPQELKKRREPAPEAPAIHKSVPEDKSKDIEPERITHVEAKAKSMEEENQYDQVVSVAEAAPLKEEITDEKSERRAKRSNERKSQPVATQSLEMQEKAFSQEEFAKSDSRQVSGVVISGEDMEPIPGAAVVMKGSNTGVVTDRDGVFNLPLQDESNTTLVASFVGMETQEYQFDEENDIQLVMQPDAMILDEVVVVGQGIQSTAPATEPNGTVKLAEDKPGRSGSAQPSVGTTAYKQYIETNMQFPEVSTSSDREVVVLKFTVSSSGDIKDIIPLRSPGEPFTQEAIRLLHEGPAWTPAKDNNESIEEIVRLRIVFKR